LKIIYLVNLHVCGQLDFSSNLDTPILRRKGFLFQFSFSINNRFVFVKIVSQYGVTPEQEMKQRRTSYLIATDQRMANRGGYIPSDFLRTNKNENYAYDIHQQKLRFAFFLLNINLK
jgi:hypothetical protein